MAAFEQVSPEQFIATMMASRQSAGFKQVLGKLDPKETFHGIPGASYVIHLGALTVDGPFEAPGVNVLILGDLTVAGAVDLKGPEEGGSFVVLGSVRCTSFRMCCGKATLIDGDFTTTRLVEMAHDKYCRLYVIGELRAEESRFEDKYARYY